MKTLAVLFSNFGPYHVARLNELARIVEKTRPDIRVAGIELCRNYSVYPWQTNKADANFSLHTVIESEPVGAFPPLKACRKLKRLLSELNPDVMAISGYSNPAMLLAMHWCRKNRKRSVLMSDSTEQDSVRIRIKELVKRSIVQRFDAALVGGAPQRRYLEALGMPPDRIFYGFDVVDNATYAHEHIASQPRPIDSPFFLTVARFIPKKNLKRLIDAYVIYSQRHPSPWHLAICGDGELRPEIESHISALDLNDRIHLPGFLQQREILPYFAHAGCLIQPSISDQWGLVVNEAMAASLPVLVSQNCGCYEDLMAEGENGFGFDPLDVHQLASLMKHMSSNDLTAMRNSSLAKIHGFPLSMFANGLLATID